MARRSSGAASTSEVGGEEFRCEDRERRERAEPQINLLEPVIMTAPMLLLLQVIVDMTIDCDSLHRRCRATRYRGRSRCAALVTGDLIRSTRHRREAGE